MGVVHDLEDQGGERGIWIVGPSQGDFFVLGVGAFHVRDFGWIGQVVNHTVENALHPNVLECGSAEHCVSLLSQNRLSDGFADVCFGQPIFVFEVLLHQVVIELRSGFDHLGAVHGGGLLQFCRDVTLFDHFTLVAGEEVGPHGDQVDHAFKGVSGANWNLHRDWDDTEALFDGVVGEVKVRSELVHLVDEADAGDAVSVGLSPHGF